MGHSTQVRAFLLRTSGTIHRLTIVIALGVVLIPAQVPATDVTSGTREEKILEGFARVQADYQRLKDEIADLIRVKFNLEPELLLEDEEVILEITARAETEPNRTIEILEGCHEREPVKHTFELDWRHDSETGEFTAIWRWTPPNRGNYLLKWTCDIGGDISEFSRNFSVIDDSFAVMVLNSTSHLEPRPEPDFHELRLPFSYWAESLLFAHRPYAENFVQLSRRARRYGDDPGLMIFKGGAYLPGDEAVFCDEPENVQRTVLECYKELWEMHGFPRPLKSLYTYGMGNGPVNVARSLGFNLLGALCADQNWGDGPFLINHWGMPARPYFINAEDFRKPGEGNENAMVGVQQCARYTAGCRDYHCVYSFEGAISYAFDQYTGRAGTDFAREIILARELNFLECLLDCAEQSGKPYFFSCGIEMNGVWTHTASINRLLMENLVERASRSPIAFTNAAAAADFFRRHYSHVPETVLYLPDVFAGLTHGGKPAHYPDTMEIENHEFKAIFRKGEALPYAQYDYTERWDYSDWGNEDIPRKPDGYVVPNTDDRFRVTPLILDTRPFKVQANSRETPGGTVVTLEVEAQKPCDNLTLAVWDIPREYSKEEGAYQIEGAERFVPVRAPFSGNLCGILVAKVRKGENRISLTVTTDPRTSKSLDLALGEQTMAKAFDRGDLKTTFLYSTSDEAQKVQITPPNGLKCTLYPSNASESAVLEGSTTITIEPGQCPVLVGLDRSQLLDSCGAAKPVDDWEITQALSSVSP